MPERGHAARRVRPWTLGKLFLLLATAEGQPSSFRLVPQEEDDADEHHQSWPQHAVDDVPLAVHLRLGRLEMTYGDDDDDDGDEDDDGDDDDDDDDDDDGWWRRMMTDDDDEFNRFK